jgi:hypothetical protein
MRVAKKAGGSCRPALYFKPVLSRQIAGQVDCRAASAAIACSSKAP